MAKVERSSEIPSELWSPLLSSPLVSSRLHDEVHRDLTLIVIAVIGRSTSQSSLLAFAAVDR